MAELDNNIINIINIINICKVQGCRYNTEHTTLRHTCGRCNINGHGQIECNNIVAICNLKQYKNDIIATPCQIIGCIDNTTHTTGTHSCLYCNRYSNSGIIHHMRYCPLNNNTIGDNSVYDNIADFSDEITLSIKNIQLNSYEYKVCSAGMGCIWFIRSNDGIIKNNQYLFMHTDSWGQYGEESSHVPRYKAFIYGYTLIE